MTSHDPRAQSDERDWRLDAACRGHDPDMWFALETHPATATALTICSGCTVRAECGEAASIGRERFGIWGGATPRTRTYDRRAAAKILRARALLDEGRTP